MAGDILFEINLDTVAAREGIGARITRLPAFRKKMIQLRDDLTEACVQAFQAKVPIDTGFLRENNIVAHPQDDPGRGYRSIIKIEGEHINRKGRREAASEIAKHLNTLKFYRSRTSQPAGPFNSSRSEFTIRWEDEAKSAFLNLYGVFLKK